MDLALPLYAEIIEAPVSAFTEEALVRSSKTLYNNGDYAAALPYYEQLESLASTPQIIYNSRVGLMRCNYLVENYENAVPAAKKVIADELINEEIELEANYIAGMSLFELETYNDALVYLTWTEENTGTERGAEALHYCAYAYFNLADFEIPTIDNTSVDFIDPFDTAKLDRFHRLDRNQNFNHDMTYLTLGIPLKIDWKSGYYATLGMRADALVQSDEDYTFGNAFVYNFGLGKTQGKFQFSAQSNFNNEGENIAKSFGFSRSFGKLDLSGRYVFKKEDQEFFMKDKKEEWALNLSITPFEKLNIQLGKFRDTLNSANTFDTASLSFTGNRWSAKYSSKYLRTTNKFDTQTFSISTDLNENSKIYFEYEEILEKAERRRIGWSYGSECMQLRADMSNYIDETADRESIDEFSIVLKLGSFGRKAAQSCG